MGYSYKTRNWWQRLLQHPLDRAIRPFAEKSASGTLNPFKRSASGTLNIFDKVDKSDFTDEIINDLASRGVDFANLSQSQIESLLDPYWETTDNTFSTAHTFDIDRFASDYDNILKANADMPEAPNAEQYWQDAKARADQEAAGSLESLKQLYDDERQALASRYNTARSDLLSSQYQQNAQLMGTVSSQLDKQQRNALEAGASAGIRLASNVNTLLSAQNKQSQTSLETANQLSQMMVNQRNAEASARSNYFDKQQNIKDAAYSKAQSYYNTEYGVAEDSYGTKRQKWDDAMWDNPLWDSKLGKSKFNNTNNTGGTYGK